MLLKPPFHNDLLVKTQPKPSCNKSLKNLKQSLILCTFEFTLKGSPFFRQLAQKFSNSFSPSLTN
jgi:hypothetical protein